MHSIFFTTLLSLLALSGSLAEVFDGALSTSNSFKYLDKFCFDQTGGLVDFELTWDSSRPGQQLLFYSDVDGQWDDVDSSSSCSEKVSRAPYAYTMEQFGNNKSATLEVIGSRPHWWYVAFANCDDGQLIGNEGLHIPRYTFTMTNSELGFLYHQFSKDQQGVLQTNGAFLALFVIILGVAVKCYLKLKSLKLQHKAMFWLTIVIAIHITALVFFVSEGGVYSKNGKGSNAVRTLVAPLIQLAAEMLFLSIIVLLGRGWVISRHFASVTRKPITFVLLGLLAAAYLATIVWYYAGSDPASVLYIYESTPGYVTLAFRLVAMLFFIVSVCFTIRRETNTVKRRAYIGLVVGYSLWFVSMPVVVLIAYFLDSWVRAKVVTILNLLISTAAYVGLIVLFRPFMSNSFVQLLDSPHTGSPMTEMTKKAGSAELDGADGSGQA